jgi:hypothetical protein
MAKSYEKWWFGGTPILGYLILGLDFTRFLWMIHDPGHFGGIVLDGRVIFCHFDRH